STDTLDLHSFPTRRSSDLSLPLASEPKWSDEDTGSTGGEGGGGGGGGGGIPEPGIGQTTQVTDANGMAYGVLDGNLVIDSNGNRSEEHTSELQSRENLVCR